MWLYRQCPAVGQQDDFEHDGRRRFALSMRSLYAGAKLRSRRSGVAILGFVAGHGMNENVAISERAVDGIGVVEYFLLSVHVDRLSIENVLVTVYAARMLKQRQEELITYHTSLVLFVPLEVAEAYMCDMLEHTPRTSLTRFTGGHRMLPSVYSPLAGRIKFEAVREATCGLIVYRRLKCFVYSAVRGDCAHGEVRPGRHTASPIIQRVKRRDLLSVLTMPP